MGCQLKRRSAPVCRYHPSLHLGEWPRDGFGVKQEECKCRVGKVEELVSVEVMNACLWVSANAYFIDVTYGDHPPGQPDPPSPLVAGEPLEEYADDAAGVLDRMEHPRGGKIRNESQIR